jgi:hypothetical protein
MYGHVHAAAATLRVVLDCDHLHQLAAMPLEVLAVTGETRTREQWIPRLAQRGFE